MGKGSSWGAGGKGNFLQDSDLPQSQSRDPVAPWVNLVANPKTQHRPLEAMSAKPTTDRLGGTAGPTPTQRSKPQFQLAGGHSVRFPWQRQPQGPLLQRETQRRTLLSCRNMLELYLPPRDQPVPDPDSLFFYILIFKIVVK